MPAGQQFLEFGKLGAEAVRRVVRVMEMDFYLPEALPAQVCQRLEVGRFVFLGRKKEGMPGGAAIAVLKMRELPGIFADPVFDPCVPLLDARPLRLGFVMVGEAQQDVNVTLRFGARRFRCCKM